jgi:hypothetical protein
VFFFLVCQPCELGVQAMVRMPERLLAGSAN